MADVVESTNLVKLKFAAYNSEVGINHFTVSLKNPSNDSETMLTYAANINSSLESGLQNIWYSDANLNPRPPVKKLVKVDIFEQTKTTSEDGKVIQTVSKQTEIFNSPFTPPD